MSRRTDLFWLKVQRQAGKLSPELVTYWLRALETLKGRLSTREVETLIARGAVAQAVALALSDTNMAIAFAPFRAGIQMVVRDTVATYGKGIPGVARAGVSVMFDTLNPKVIDAVRRLDTEVMKTLSTGIRESVRSYIQQGLEAGVGPRTMARGLRGALGLSPSQLGAVTNYENALRGGPRESVLQGALDKVLRDRRYDATVAAAKEGGYSLTEAQITTMTAAYKRRMIAFNAETNARTAALDAVKLGQDLAWRDAADKGVIELSQLVKTWVGVMDDREREEHIAMEGQTVPFDQPYPSPSNEMIPGESTYNCRCISDVTALRS